MGKIHNIEENQPHITSNVICSKCKKEWVAVRPVDTSVNILECSICGQGHVVETGKKLDMRGRHGNCGRKATGRTRKDMLYARFTKDEKQSIIDAAAKSKMTQSDFILKMCLNKD
jgi:hypothetical protein